jgi:hypothetical protein
MSDRSLVSPDIPTRSIWAAVLMLPALTRQCLDIAATASVLLNPRSTVYFRPGRSGHNRTETDMAKALRRPGYRSNPTCLRLLSLSFSLVIRI